MDYKRITNGLQADTNKMKWGKTMEIKYEKAMCTRLDTRTEEESANAGFPPFDADKVTEDIVCWIKDFFAKNGKDCNAIVAISGGKDSSVTAALCVKALGKERVKGLLLPNGEQADIDMSRLLIKTLGIESFTINIDALCKDALTGLGNAFSGTEYTISRMSGINLPPRLRMAMTYALSQSLNGRVANTSNLSEDWVGYATRYGDAAGDFSPLSRLTVREVKAVGRCLGLPEILVGKVPVDGLSGMTDEDNLGFTYAVLDRYIRTGVCADADIKEKIDAKHRANRFKLEPLPVFPFDAPVLAAE